MFLAPLLRVFMNIKTGEGGKKQELGESNTYLDSSGTAANRQRERATRFLGMSCTVPMSLRVRVITSYTQPGPRVDYRVVQYKQVVGG